MMGNTISHNRIIDKRGQGGWARSPGSRHLLGSKERRA